MDINLIKSLFNNAVLGTTPLAEIVLDAGTQQRSKINAERVEDYKEVMESGKAKDFPPVKLVALTEAVQMPDGSTLEIGTTVLVDGFHRIDGAAKAKLMSFQSETVQGTLDEAIYYSMTANSTNGVSMAGKDYQNAIRKLYTLDGGYWRAHGRKQEIADLFGCSTKSVERATSAIDKQTKADAYAMFDKGEDLQVIAELSFKSIKTIKEWYTEWEEAKAKAAESEGPKGSQGSQDGPSASQDDSNPLNLTVEQVLKLANKELKAKLLKILLDALQGPEETEGNPWEEAEESNESNEEPIGAPEGDELEALAAQWASLDWWDVLELDLATLQGLKNPKAAIKRAYTKQLKRCHTDKHGDNRACDVLKEAIAAANKMFK